MRKYLLPEKGNFYKANLHCHSTISDGGMTPEEIKSAYSEMGYSIVAFTDHDVLIPHSELADEKFLPLNGYEMEIRVEDSQKTCHMCLIAIDPDNLTQVCYHRSKYLFCNAVNYADKVKFDESEPDYERYYTPECISDMMKRGRDNGFFVTYNHPTWSLESYADYNEYHNMCAMEIYNHECNVVGYPEYNERVYDDMLRSGKRIYCIATDDNHKIESCFGGFTMIKAEKLEYKAVTTALVNGEFYASQGPEIYSLWFEDGKIHIDCSEVAEIRFNTGVRHSKKVTGRLTNAEFEVKPEDVYVRVTIIDSNGKIANTNAYFTDELFR